MAGKGRFAKRLLVSHSLQHALRCLDMHPLDHLILKTLGTAMEGFDELARTFDLAS